MSLSTAAIAGIAIASGVVLLGGGAYFFGKGGNPVSNETVTVNNGKKIFKAPEQEVDDIYAGGSKSSKKKHYRKKNHSKKNHSKKNHSKKKK